MNPLKKYSYLIASIIIIIFITGFYYTNFCNHLISPKTEDWGNFGSYIGGVSSALLSLITLILLIETLTSQNKYNFISRFENSFFELIKINREIIHNTSGDVQIQSGNYKQNAKYEGIEYFNSFALSIDQRFDSNYNYIFKKIMNVNEDANINFTLGDVKKEYKNLLQNKENQLGHYFRSFYQIFSFINSTPEIEKKRYFDLVRSIINDSEYYLLFYNTISLESEINYLEILDKYNFFGEIKSKGEIFENHFHTFYPLTYKKFKLLNIKNN